MDILDNLKRRCQMYLRGSISFDDLCGYMQALEDVGYLSGHDIEFIIRSVLSNNPKNTDWIYE